MTTTLIICAYIVACTLYLCHCLMDDIDFALGWYRDTGVWALPIAVVAGLLLPVFWLLIRLRKVLEWIT